MATKLTIQADINARVETVWKVFTDPAHIVQWNAASDDWHTTKATNDLVVGGRFSSTMAAKDGTRSFDFSGEYTRLELHEKIEYELDDKRVVSITFTPLEDGKKTRVVETFEAEGTNPPEMQQKGWQAILDNFKKHTEAAQP